MGRAELSEEEGHFVDQLGEMSVWSIPDTCSYCMGKHFSLFFYYYVVHCLSVVFIGVYVHIQRCFETADSEQVYLRLDKHVSLGLYATLYSAIHSLGVAREGRSSLCLLILGLDRPFDTLASLTPLPALLLSSRLLKPRLAPSGR